MGDIDPVSEFARLKTSYIAQRGGVHGTGNPVVETKLVPKTTWADVNAFGLLFLKETLFSPNIASMGLEQKTFCDMMPACKKWTAYFPSVLSESGTFSLALKLQSGEVFPYNEAFWGYGSQYAIAISAAGARMSKLDIALESVKEAVEELPATIGGAVSKVLPDVPGLGLGFGIDWSKWMFWGLVGTGLYFLIKSRRR